MPDNVRIYVLAGAQHIEVPFPPPPRGQAPTAGTAAGAAGRNDGQQSINPTPQSHVMRALLRALHGWAANGTPSPDSRYPRLADKTLVAIADVTFPTLPDEADPRSIEGPARRIAGTVVPLPHLVPQVDRDENDVAGIRVPEVAVPLATTTGWNVRSPSVGNPGVIYQLLRSYIPFAATNAARQANGDPRPSIEERYRGPDDYLQRIRAAALESIRDRYLLDEDLDPIHDRAKAHWIHAAAAQPRAADGPPSKRMADGKGWTTKNLDVDPAPSFCYNGSPDNCRKYGRLYPWASAQQACPALGGGWRLPTNDEWRALGVGYGGLREDTADKDRAAYEALIAGGSSGFDVVFGGGRTDKDLQYQRIDAHGFYWTATESGAGTAWMYNFGRNGVSMNRHADAGKLRAFAVRCIRD